MKRKKNSLMGTWHTCLQSKTRPLSIYDRWGSRSSQALVCTPFSASTTRGHSTRSKRRRLQLYANKSNYFADLDLHANLRLPARNVLLERRRPVGRKTLAQGILGF